MFYSSGVMNVELKSALMKVGMRYTDPVLRNQSDAEQRLAKP